MNKEDFVSYPQALKLKELGFREDCLYYYDVVSKDELLPNTCYMEYDSTNTDDLYDSHNKRGLDDICDAPTLWQVQKWLRKEKGFYIMPIFTFRRPEGTCTYHLCSKDEDFEHSFPGEFNSPEEALSAGITKCINLLYGRKYKSL